MSKKRIAIVIGCSNGNKTLYNAFDKGIELCYKTKPKQRPILFCVDETGIIASTWNKWGNDYRSREVVQKFHDLDGTDEVKTIYIIENEYNADHTDLTIPYSLLAWYAMFPEKCVMRLRTQLNDVVEAIRDAFHKLDSSGNEEEEIKEVPKPDSGNKEMINKKIEESFNDMMNKLRHEEARQ